MPNVKSNKVKAAARLDFRLAAENKRLIEQAAVISGQTVSDFVLSNVIKTAQEVVEKDHTTVLSNRDRDLFLAMLDANDEPNEALKKGFSEYQNYLKERQAKTK